MDVTVYRGARRTGTDRHVAAAAGAAGGSILPATPIFTHTTHKAALFTLAPGEIYVGYVYVHSLPSQW